MACNGRRPMDDLTALQSRRELVFNLCAVYAGQARGQTLENLKKGDTWLEFGVELSEGREDERMQWVREDDMMCDEMVSPLPHCCWCDLYCGDFRLPSIAGGKVGKTCVIREEGQRPLEVTVIKTDLPC